MAALREILAKFTTEVDTSDLKKAQKAISNTEKRLNSFKGNLAKFAASGVIAMGFRRLAAGFVEVSHEADQMVKSADNLGTSAEKLFAWQHVASRAGVAAETMSNAFRKVSVSVLQAEQGSKTAVDAFAEIGLSVEDLAGKAPEEQVLRVGKALSGLEDISKRNAIASVLLGRKGAMLNKMFSDPALEEQLQRYKELSPVTSQAGRQFETINDSVGDITVIFKGLAAELAISLAPAVKSVSGALEGFLKFLRANKAAMFAFKATLAVLATFITGVFVFAVGSMTAGMIASGVAAVTAAGGVKALTIATMASAKNALIAAANYKIFGSNALAAFGVFAIAFLILEDLFTFITGGESVFEDLMDKMWEAFDLEKYVFPAIDAIITFGSDVEQIFNGIGDFISETWNRIPSDVDYVLSQVYALFQQALNWINENFLNSSIFKSVKSALSILPGFGDSGEQSETGGGQTVTLPGSSSSSSVNAPFTNSPNISMTFTGNADPAVVQGAVAQGVSTGASDLSAVQAATVYRK